MSTAALMITRWIAARVISFLEAFGKRSFTAFNSSLGERAWRAISSSVIPISSTFVVICRPFDAFPVPYSGRAPGGAQGVPAGSCDSICHGRYRAREVGADVFLANRV